MRARSAVWAVLLIMGLVLIITGITGTLPDVLGCILIPASMETAAPDTAPGAAIRNALPPGTTVPGTGGPTGGLNGGV